jgi:hypothetical protein
MSALQNVIKVIKSRRMSCKMDALNKIVGKDHMKDQEHMEGKHYK